MQILNVRWQWNVPNVLSLIRILLVPVFLVLYLSDRQDWAFLTLLVSGVTDVLDGFIARRFNMITDCGKLLDPISDKLTQVAVVIAMATRYAAILPLAALCLLKEACQAVGGVILLKKGCTVHGSKWFGKASTVVFYVCMLVLVLWGDVLPPMAAWALIGVAGLCMLLAFAGYLQMFIQISRTEISATDNSDQIPEKG
ncbi:MAG: CDP-alcohol phosphatidyltransferase family protein [Clostridia bacterium]|nr:CDP-alcohol phosphatidyltransferase family protein [Clostridia bacterium]